MKKTDPSPKKWLAIPSRPSRRCTMPKHPLMWRALVVVCVAALGSSCIPSLTQNKPREANKAVPKGFASTQPTPSAAAQGESSGQKNWSEFFADARLRGLIDTALKNNQELNIRLQEIIIAKSEVMARQGEYIPRVDARAGAGIDKA